MENNILASVLEDLKHPLKKEHIDYVFNGASYILLDMLSKYEQPIGVPQSGGKLGAIKAISETRDAIRAERLFQEQQARRA